MLLMAILGAFVAYMYSRFISPVIESNQAESLQTPIPLNFSSSVFCTGQQNHNNIECRFQNLCYHAEQFWYFHGVNTNESGLPASSPLILDLSSVKDHNAKYFKYVNSSARPTFRTMRYIQKSGILFHRFNPDNLMHVIHDDLFPFFHTKRQHFPNNDVVTVFMEGREPGLYYHLYELFMHDVLNKKELNSFTCFQNVVVGVNKKVTWYQYGFQKPQGPINVNGYPKEKIQLFKNYFTKRLKIQDSSIQQQQQQQQQQHESPIVLFKRHYTRRILNEMKLVLKLSSSFKCVVTTLDLEEDSIKHIINTISNAKILIGVHGAHLVTSLFLPPNAMLVELFPFGIPSENYTPYKTLAGLLVNVSYVAWENAREENSLTFPNRPPELGGITHLPLDKQKEITSTKKIKKHLCCNDPFWLYRIYQDTKVDIDHLLVSLQIAMGIQK